MGTFTAKEIVSSVMYATLGLDEPSVEDGQHSTTTPQVLCVLGSVLEKLIAKNEKLLRFKSPKNRIKATGFHGSRAPTLSIRQYMERIHKYTRCSPSCFVVALVYADRYVEATGFYITSLNAHRLFLTCALLAAKFIDDACCSNTYYAKVGGISASEINKLETDLLLSLDFRLHVTVETFDQYCLRLHEEASGDNCSLEEQQRIQLCGKMGSSWHNRYKAAAAAACCGKLGGRGGYSICTAM